MVPVSTFCQKLSKQARAKKCKFIPAQVDFVCEINIENKDEIVMDNAQKFKLLELIRQRPILWDSSLPNFHRNDERTRCWQEISQELKLPQTKLNSSFHQMKRYYRKQLQSFMIDGTQPKWEYFGAMDFLRPVTKFKNINEATSSPIDNEPKFNVQPGEFIPRITSTTQKRRAPELDGVPMNKKPKIENITINNGCNKALVPNPVYQSPLQEPMSSVNDVNLENQNNGMTSSNSNQNVDEDDEEEQEIPLRLGQHQIINLFVNLIAARLDSLQEVDANLLMTKIFTVMNKPN